MKTKELILQSERNRKRLIEIIYKAKAGHIGGDLSCLNVLTALYFDVMMFIVSSPGSLTDYNNRRSLFLALLIRPQTL